MLFSSLTMAHATKNRVRFSYRSPLGLLGAKHCPWDVHALFKNLPIESAQCNSRIASLTLYFDSQKTTPKALEKHLKSFKINDLPLKSTVNAPFFSKDAAPSFQKLVQAGLVTLLSRFAPLSWQAALALSAALPLALKAKKELCEKGLTSHVLEAAAVGVSISRSDYFAANITSFLLALGEYLEHSIERRSDDLLMHLMRPNTDPVWIIENNQEKQIEHQDLKIGHHVIVGIGAMIPVDGTVLKGQALVNQASMTGESLPVVKERGDKVLSGTVITEGRIVIYAEKVGNNAAAARIAQFVAQSLNEKSQTQFEAATLADKTVPAVLGLAATTYLLTADLNRVAAVVQADYSCALKLATPVAFKSSMYAAGSSGVLVKGASALERLALADTFVFDKTGTLTTGDLNVTDVLTFHPDFSEENLICLAASIEEHYIHPMAKAVVEASRHTQKPHHFDHKEVQFIVAHGVASIVDGKRIVVGSQHFVEEDEGIDFSRHKTQIDQLVSSGKTLLYIGFGGKALGVLALEDSIRHNSALMVAQLKKLGVKKIVMLTGDVAQHAQKIATQLGLDECHAQLMPEDKAHILQKMIQQGDKIAFVGDGINDAPALSGAQVGIAMHRGADIAQLASDIVLLKDDIQKVAHIKALANANQKLINSNFRLIMGLNTGILAAASLGLLNPVSAALLHNGSTISILIRAFLGVGKNPR